MEIKEKIDALRLVIAGMDLTVEQVLEQLSNTYVKNSALPSNAIDTKCPLAYLSKDGKKEILPYYDPSRKDEIVGIYSPSAKEVVALKNLDDSAYAYALEQAKGASVRGIKALLPSKYNDGIRLCNDKDSFDATAAFLRECGIDADDWKNDWYWFREGYNIVCACHFNMSSPRYAGSVYIVNRINNDVHVRCVLAW